MPGVNYCFTSLLAHLQMKAVNVPGTIVETSHRNICFAVFTGFGSEGMRYRKMLFGYTDLPSICFIVLTCIYRNCGRPLRLFLLSI